MKNHPFILQSSFVVLFTAFLTSNFRSFALENAPATTTATEELPEMVVTATREGELLKETPASIGLIKPAALKLNGPTHPQQILGQIPGVAISVTNGEGHQTAIRQPFTTSPLYLFLEDGIPVRPTGFFNHNALYEVNIPMAGGIEVVRGPGSALYGSDAIGGVINVLSRPSEPRPAGSLSSELGSFGWRRFLGSASSGPTKLGSFRTDLNLTHTDGWRAKTGYDRQSGNIRWDYEFDADTTLKTIASYTNIDQKTGANSPLPAELYHNSPKTNLFSAAYRKVEALRISSQFEKILGDSLLSVTPYFRSNKMDLNGSYNFSSDPRIEKTESLSFGLLSKWRHDFPDFYRTRIILGLDLENSPGSRTEDALNTLRTGTGASTNYFGYTIGRRIYDYDITFKSVSPYLHTEISPLEKLRVTLGARFDSLSYDMHNNLPSGTAVNSGANFWGQSPSDSRTFQRLSPKIGATYELTKKTSLYASYNQGFRAPSEAQLYRGGRETSNPRAQSRAASALLLKPIKADEFELGIRGDALGVQYSLAAYELVKKDDLISQKDPTTNASINQNAGKTESRGVELSLGRNIVKTLKLETALSYAKHEYTRWSGKSGAGAGTPFDYTGNEMAFAPRFIGNTRLTWTPTPSFNAQLEWVSLGSYFLQDSNTPTTVGTDTGVSKYKGHDLFNLRATYDVNKNVSVFGRIINLADTRYADSASVSSNTAVYSPGLPRTFYGGVEVKF